MNDLDLRTWEDAAHDALISLEAGAFYDLDPEELNMFLEHDIKVARNHVLSRESDPILTISLIALGRSAIALLHHMGEWDLPTMLRILCVKQHDYGHENINALGTLGLVVRTSDKVARWGNLSDNDEMGLAEPALDALLDIVGYAAISIMYVNGTFQYPLSDDWNMFVG